LLNDYFLVQIKKIFKIYEVKFNLSLTTEKNMVIYKSKTINFNVYFEKNFEIYIVFNTIINEKTESIELQSIVDFLNDENLDCSCLIRNEISCEEDIDFVLNGLFEIINYVLIKIINNDKILYDSYQYQKNKYQAYCEIFYYNQMSQEINNAWKIKNFKDILEICQKYMKKDKNIDQYLTEKQKKQIRYSESKCIV